MKPKSSLFPILLGLLLVFSLALAACSPTAPVEQVEPTEAAPVEEEAAPVEEEAAPVEEAAPTEEPAAPTEEPAAPTEAPAEEAAVAPQ
jgi:outer membrane biosynthesis protein TonB